MTKKDSKRTKRGFIARPTQAPREQVDHIQTTNKLPLVSICTVTHNRPKALKVLEQRILSQTYPRNSIEWVLIDDSPEEIPDFQPLPNTNLRLVYKRLSEKLTLGKKRNFSNNICSGTIIVYMDDDDYYPPTRVEHAVERLRHSEALVAGSTILPIFFLPEKELWVSGPFNGNHATANTFAFKRELLELTRFTDEATQAEERDFLKNYSIPMVQLDPKHTIICIGHNRNTYEKRQLIQGGSNPRFTRLTDLTEQQWILLEQISKSYLDISKPGDPAIQNSNINLNHSKSTCINFKILIFTSKIKGHTARCIRSLQRQQHIHFKAIIIAHNRDCAAEVESIQDLKCDDRFQVHINTISTDDYLENFILGVRALKPTMQDIIIPLEGDFSFYSEDVLSVLAHTYQRKQCLLTYGGLALSSEKTITTSQIDARIEMHNNSRRAGWLMPQLRTFKAGLLELIDPRSLHDNEGKLLTDTGEATLFYSLFEISSHRSEHIAAALLISNLVDRGDNNQAQIPLNRKSITPPYALAPFLGLNTPSDLSSQAKNEKICQQFSCWAGTSEIPMISAIMPTQNRPEYLIKAVQAFQSQTWPNKELLILDDSEHYCPEVRDVANYDARIRYYHQSNKESIGTKRQKLCDMARGAIIAHLDDDDYYCPSYLEVMAMNLLQKSAEFIKLRSWWSIHAPSQIYGYCNTELLDSTRFYHISSQGTRLFPRTFSKEEVYNSLYGYGFSYVYKKSILSKAQHPHGIYHKSDIKFAKDCMEAGARIDLIDDTLGIVFHIIHSSNTSSCFAHHLISESNLRRLTYVTPPPPAYLSLT